MNASHESLAADACSPPLSPSAPRSSSPAFWGAFIVFAAAFVIRAPFAQYGNLSPDAVDYIDIARNIAHGRGVTQSIQWHYFTDASVPRPAWGERPVLLSILLAPLIAFNDSLVALQTFNSMLGALGAALLFLWVRRVCGDLRIALWSAALYALCPAAIMCSVYVWTEPLFVIVLIAVFIALDAGRPHPHNPSSGVGSQSAAGEGAAPGLPPSMARAAGAGALAALAFYARPTGILLLPAAIVVLGARRQWKALAAFTAVMIAMMVPHHVLVAQSHNSPFYSIQSQHFRVGHIEDAMNAGFGRAIPTAGQFIASHASAVAQAIVGHFIQYSLDLFSLPYLGVLGFFAVVALIAPLRRSPYALPVVFAILHFFAVGVIWAGPVDSNRFLLVPLVCLWPPALEALKSWRQSNGRLEGSLRRACVTAAALAITVVFYIVLGVRLHDHCQRNARSRPDSPAFEQFVNATPPGAVLAASDVFIANFLFRRPTLALPSPAEPDAIRRFVKKYRPHFLLTGPDAESSLAPLTAEGLLGRPMLPPESPFLWWPVRVSP